MSDETNNENNLPEPDWKFEDDADKEMGIETKRYPNGQVLKRCKLSDGREAVARRLKGNDGREVSRLTAGEQDKYRVAIAAMCVTVNGEKVTPEEIDDLWFDDVTRITMLASINFPIAQNV